MLTNNDTSDQMVFRKLELKKRSTAYRILNNLLKCPYVLIAPAIIIALGTTVISIIFCIGVSFFKWDLLSNTITFVGLANYQYIFTSDVFLKTLGNTFIFLAATVLGGLMLKVICGVFLNRNTFRHNLVQTIMFTPYIIASVAIAVIFMYLMQPEGGVFNSILGFFGIAPLKWHLGESTALFSLIVVALWQGLGYGVLIVISGLKSIPNYVYEAARLDRSSRLNTFFHITVPLLSPTIFYLLVVDTVSAFTTFDVVKLMTDGGPDNATNMLAFYVYQQGYQFMHYGRAMAASVVLLIFTSSLSLIQFRIARQKVHYQ